MILDLCAGTGAWSEPYVKAGYNVQREDAVVRAAIRDGLAKGIHAPRLAALLAQVEAES